MATKAEIQRLVTKNSNNILRVGILAQNEVRQVLRPAKNLSFNDQAGLVRTAIPAIADRYGNLSQVLALDYYQDFRALNNVKGNFTPKATKLDLSEKLDNLMGTGIAAGYNTGYQALENYLSDGITRITAAYNRDTIIDNASFDTQAAMIQRVANATACSFCIGQALEASTSEVIVSGNTIIEYQNDWHDNCGCTSEVIYEGQDLIRPSYYDSFEADYTSAKESLSAKREAAVEEAKANGTFDRYSTFLKANPQYSITRSNIAAELRSISGRK